MTLRSVLAGAAGIWDGTYTHLSPDGDVIERYASQRELPRWSYPPPHRHRGAPGSSRSTGGVVVTQVLDNGAVVRLHDDELPWSTTTIPDSSPDVGIVRLHVDPATGASVSVVRFPDGFSRPATGRYSCAEEFTVLSGWLELNGQRYTAGEGNYLPPFATRFSMSSGGAAVLAWFSGPTRWSSGSSDVAVDSAPTAGTTHGPRVRNEDQVDAVDRDVLWVDDAAWAWVPAGVAVSDRPGRRDVRRWPS